MPDAIPVTLHALSAETADGVTSALDIGALRKLLQLTLDVRAVVGTPSLTVDVETSPDSASWGVIRTFGPITAPTRLEASIALGVERHVRASYRLTGTGSVAFSLGGQAHVVYADLADLTNYAIPAQALGGVSLDTQANKMLAVSTIAADYLAAAYDMPLAAWGDSLSMHVAHMGAYLIINERGLDPGGADKTYEDRYKESIAWLKEIKGGLRPEGIVDAVPQVLETAAYVYTRRARGWDRGF